MTSIPQIRFLKLRTAPTYWNTLFEIHVDGVKVGIVGRQTVTHDRKPPGSRIVTRRTKSDRWFAGKATETASRIWQDTRKEATFRFLADFMDVEYRTLRVAMERAREYLRSEKRPKTRDEGV